jgi:hypothetical protein
MHGAILGSMMDESQSEARPLDSTDAPAKSAMSMLRREVEPPRTAASLWLPLMALASATMLTIVCGVAVMTRAPRAMLVAPADAPPSAPEVEPTTAALEDPNARFEAMSKAQLREEVDRIIEQQKALQKRHQAWRRENLEEVHVPCNAPVHRGDLDGRPQPSEECVTSRPKAAR